MGPHCGPSVWSMSNIFLAWSGEGREMRSLKQSAQQDVVHIDFTYTPLALPVHARVSMAYVNVQPRSQGVAHE